MVGIAVDRADKVREFAAKYGIPYPVLIAGPEVFGLLGRLGDSGGALPYTVALDRSRAVSYRKLGALKAGELEAALGTLLQ